MPFTQLVPNALPGRRYGSFSGKTPSSLHPVGIITQLMPGALPGARYSSFAGKPSFPAQFSGLRTYYSGAVKELCLVAEADAPAGMGGVMKIDKNGTKYAVYLVETTDVVASFVRI